MLNRLSIPVITDEAVDKLLRFLKVDVITKDTTMFEIGYRQCKEDVVNLLIRECKLDTSKPVDKLLAEIRKRSDD